MYKNDSVPDEYTFFQDMRGNFIFKCHVIYNVKTNIDSNMKKKQYFESILNVINFFKK